MSANTAIATYLSGTPTLVAGDVVRWMQDTFVDGSKRADCVAAAKADAEIYGGVLSAAAATTVFLPPGSYKLCAARVNRGLGAPKGRRALQATWSGDPSELIDGHFTWHPEITVFSDRGASLGVVSTALTSNADAGTLWWLWLILGLLFCCLPCCIFLLCYSRQQRRKIIYHRRGAVQLILDAEQRAKLGMAKEHEGERPLVPADVAPVLEDESSMISVVRDQIATEDATPDLEENSMFLEMDREVIETRDGDEVGFLYHLASFVTMGFFGKNADARGSLLPPLRKKPPSAKSIWSSTHHADRTGSLVRVSVYNKSGYGKPPQRPETPPRGVVILKTKAEQPEAGMRPK